ncbi:DNA-binding transcriptional ArsR family regulator [Variovorax sp. GrIS 2.14]|uniref:hypothetical protein n=1 Tax=Variovorax sp. GrIS 2.14 TaxID=3071709 RepID=UPI0038F7C1AC
MTTPAIKPTDCYAELPLGFIAMLTHEAVAIHVWTTIVKEAATGGANLSVKFPKRMAVKLLVSGTERQVEQQRALLAGNDLPTDAATIELVPVGLYKGFNFFGQEGIFLLQSRWRKPPSDPELWIFTSKVEDFADPFFVSALGRLSALAKSSNRRLIAIIEGECSETIDLANFVDELIEVRGCEADVDGGIAFSVDCHSYQGLASFGLGKVMCILKYGQDYRYERSYAPFVAKTLRTRAIRILSGNGHLGSEIAAIVGLDKSNVSRHLSHWQPRRIEMPEGWIDRLREHFATDGQVVKPKAKAKSREITTAEFRVDREKAQRAMDEDEDEGEIE